MNINCAHRKSPTTNNTTPWLAAMYQPSSAASRSLSIFQHCTLQTHSHRACRIVGPYPIVLLAPVSTNGSIRTNDMKIRKKTNRTHVGSVPVQTQIEGSPLVITWQCASSSNVARCVVYLIPIYPIALDKRPYFITIFNFIHIELRHIWFQIMFN